MKTIAMLAIGATIGISFTLLAVALNDQQRRTDAVKLLAEVEAREKECREEGGNPFECRMDDGRTTLQARLDAYQAMK